MLTRRTVAAAALALGALLPLSGIAHAAGIPMGGVGGCTSDGAGGMICKGIASTDPTLGSGSGSPAPAPGSGNPQPVGSTQTGSGGPAAGGSSGGGGGGTVTPVNNVNWGPFLPGSVAGPKCPGAVTGPNLQGCTAPPPAAPVVQPAGGPAAPPPPPPPPNPAVVALQASSQLPIPKPVIGSAPCTTAGCKGAVGVPVWLWVTNWKAPASSTASVGGVSVTATAKITSVDWSMGDGNMVHCTTPGTVYQDAMGWAKSPDCGYVYPHRSAGQPGGKFNMTATAHYSVTWSGAYVGTVNLTTSSTAGVTIGEYQVLTQ